MTLIYGIETSSCLTVLKRTVFTHINTRQLGVTKFLSGQPSGVSDCFTLRLCLGLKL